jgi:hypothetical protein
MELSFEEPQPGARLGTSAVWQRRGRRAKSFEGLLDEAHIVSPAGPLRDLQQPPDGLASAILDHGLLQAELPRQHESALGMVGEDLDYVLWVSGLGFKYGAEAIMKRRAL